MIRAFRAFRAHRSTMILLLALPVVAGSASATEYTIDGAHSFVLFQARHFGVSNVYGRFNDFSGTISYDEANPAKSSIEIEVRTESVDTGVERRDNHLRSPDFFNAKQFPILTFESTEVKKTGEKSFAVTGNVTLLGVTKPVTADVELLGAGKHPRSGADLIGFEARFEVTRSDFGMDYMMGPISDRIGVTVALEAGAAE